MTNNPLVKGPRVAELQAEGLYLSRHYVYKFCSPTRGSFLSARYPFRLGNTKSNFIPWSRPDGLELGFDTLPLRLKKLQYNTHHVGKWHQGFHTPDYTPVARGFNTSYGFLQGGEDHYTHWCGAAQADCHIPGGDGGWTKAGAWDLWSQSVDDFPGHPVLGINGSVGDDATYSGYIFTKRVVDIVRAHAEAFAGSAAAAPLHIYWALHNTHAPIEAPPRFVSLYSHFNDPKKETFTAMVSVVDESVKNVTSALKATGLWDSTVFVWTTDNGSPVQAGGSNHPLREIPSIHLRASGNLIFVPWMRARWRKRA